MEHWALNFFEKITLKHVWILLGTLLGILGILKIYFLKIFENSTLHGTLGKKIFRKISHKTSSKHVWILLGTILGIFGILKKKFSENFRKLDPPRNTGQKNYSKNLTQNKFKTRLDTFGNDFGHFWNFANFLIFFGKISKTRPSMENWVKIFRKNCPKLQSKHVWILLATILGIFGILKLF